MSKAVFLDRDGVINHNVYYEDTREWESPRTLEKLKIIDGSLLAMKALQDKGYLLFIVSNQPSYAKGKTSLDNLKSIDEELKRRAKKLGIAFTATYYCYHHPDSKIAGFSMCQCRKPSPYFLFMAEREYQLDLKKCYFFGDRDSDMLCARQAGISEIPIRPDHEFPNKSEFTGKNGSINLLSAVEKINKETKC